MGIAASQARYLYLTARQTNVEFEGQQINQARTNLANEQAGLFRELLEIEAPVMPTLYTVQQDLTAWAATNGPDPSNYTAGENDPQYQYDMSLWSAYINGGNDPNAAYNVAVNEYNAKQRQYEQAMEQINLKSEEIHQRDQVLELQLRQLDTEQQTIVTELESVKKVIDKNIENVFKSSES